MLRAIDRHIHRDRGQRDRSSGWAANIQPMRPPQSRHNDCKTLAPRSRVPRAVVPTAIGQGTGFFAPCKVYDAETISLAAIFRSSAIRYTDAATATVATSETPMPKSIASLTAADFEPHRGESFHLAGTAELELKLVEVQRRGVALREAGAFSLLFMSAAGPFLPQAIYAISHPALGSLELFFVPLGPQQDGNLYEVIFT